MRSFASAAPDGLVFRRSAAVAPASFDSAALTVEVTWTTGAAVDRLDLWAGEAFVETLEVTPRAVRLDRLNAGGPVLDCHNQFQNGALIGSIVPGTARVANGTGTATVRLSDTPDAADTVAKIRAGHLRSLSVGYRVHTFTRFRGEEGERDEYRATDWEPLEISFVSVPADPGAIVRSRSEDMTRIIEGGRRTRTPSRAPAIINRAGFDDDRHDDDRDPAPRARRGDDDGGRRDRHDDDGRREDRSRGNRAMPVSEGRIRALCDRANFSRDFERSLLDDHAEHPFTEAQLLRAVNDEMIAQRGERANIDAREGERRDPQTGRAIGEGRNGRSAGYGMANAMEDALYARLSGATPTDEARQFMGASMADMARGLMEQRGERVRWDSPARIMQRFGAHTTSDFPNLLQAATGRYLLDLYAAVPAPLKVLSRKRVVPDFRMIYALSILPVGSLRRVPENAEFKRVTVQEGLSGYKLTTFGEIFSMTRQAFINDDLGYFHDLATMWARAAAETEATQLAGIVVGNGAQLGDAVALYDASRGNLSATGDAITIASLSAARLAMRSQKNPDGTAANVAPKYLVVGPAKETEAQQVLATLAAVNQPSQVNPFSGQLELIVDPRLIGNSWRLFADPNIWPVLEYAQLQGQEGLFTDERIGFDIDGFDFKARIDFGAGPVDHRGTFKNPGN